MDKQIVYLFVFDTLADWEAGYAIAGINSPDFQQQPDRYCVQTLGLTNDPVTTIGGMTILPDVCLNEVDEGAMLILPGGEAWNEGKTDQILETAKAFLQSNIPIAAICGATAGLARAGILDDKPHTSNSLAYLQATADYKGAAFYQEQPAVMADNVITAHSTAPLEFAYQIFKALDLYTPATLEAWYGFFKTGDAKHLEALSAPLW
ncbi:MAG: type 1 glutamine amidotransferase family protein [Synechococcales bacterium]|nr:type 1 glutamine amidotransferase family protein [Synechococcales bacterium]